jgi:hypothetical protein
MNPNYVDIADTKVSQFHIRSSRGFWWIDLKNTKTHRTVRLIAVPTDPESGDLAHIEAKEMEI